MTLFLACFTVYLYLKTILVQFTVENNIPGYRFGISTIAANLFLYSQGYKTDYKKVNIVFTPEEQEGVRLLLEVDDNPTSSMNLSKEGDTMTIWEQYSQNALVNIMNGTEIERQMIDMDEDFYAYLCLALDPTKPRKAACYNRARTFIEKFGNLLPVKPIKSKVAVFDFIKKALAACVGTIPCGGDSTGYHCPEDNNSDCRSTKTCPKGSCLYGDYCDPTLNTLDCSIVSNQSSCQAAGISQCAVSCNTSGDTFCTWGGTATPPPGGGGCTCNCMSATNPSCDNSRVGLWNIAFKTGGGNTTPVGESYITTVPNYLPSGLNICADAGSISRVVSFFRPHPKKILCDFTILRRGL